MWITLALTSAFFSAAAAIVEKKALFKIEAFSFSLLLAIFNLLLSLPFLAWVDLNSIETNAIILLFVKSFMGAVSFLLVMYGLKKLEISSSLPLLVLTPGVVALLAYFILGEAISRIEMGGMCFLLIGTYALQLKSGQKLLAPFKSALQHRAYYFIIGAIILFSLTSIMDKMLVGRMRMTPEAYIPLQHLFTLIDFILMYFLIPVFKKESLKRALKLSWKLILWVSIFTIIYRYSQIWAVKLGSVALVLSVKRTSVFFAILIGGRLFKEKNLLQKSIATIIMIAGAILLILF